MKYSARSFSDNAHLAVRCKSEEVMLDKINAFKTSRGDKPIDNLKEIEFYQYYKDDFIYTAARIARYVQEPYEKFISAVNRECQKLKITLGQETSCPHMYEKDLKYTDRVVSLAVPMLKDGKFFLYEFIDFPMGISTSLKNCSFLSAECLSPVRNLYKTEMAHDKKRVKWTSYVKRLKNRREISLARWLVNNTDASVKNVPDHKIQAAANAIIEDYMPLQVRYASTPEDFMEVYNKGPQSCMSYNSKRGWANGGKLPAIDGFDSTEFHPVLWYMYCPYTKLAFIRQNGNVTARAVLWKLEKGGWGYTRMYSSTPNAREKMEESFKTEGVVALSSWSNKVVQDPEPFNLPLDSSDRFPVPYFDGINNSFYYYQDKDNSAVKCKLFAKTASGAKLSGNIPIDYTQGYSSKSNISGRVCDVCGNHCTSSKIQSEDGKIFCSVKCMHKIEYDRVYDSSGNRRVRHISGSILASSGVRYTTYHAAFSNGLSVGVAKVPDKKLQVVRSLDVRWVKDGNRIKSGEIMYGAAVSGAQFPISKEHITVNKLLTIDTGVHDVKNVKIQAK